MIGITTDLSLYVAQNANEASLAGFDRQSKYKDATPVSITNAVVVKKGTTHGNATVDLVMVDKDGKQYVAMVTMNLLKMIVATDNP